MEVTALCIRLMLEVLVLLVIDNHGYLAPKADAAFPRVHPDRLQFFLYEKVSVNCEELSVLAEWRVMRKLPKTSPPDSYSWNSSAPSRTFKPILERDSGEYWCEDEGGNRSDAVNITITAGFVILEVSTRPAVEGYDVTLHCRKKESQSNHIADFYKDGFQLRTEYKNGLLIQNFSKSDEGFYKCIISGAGESPQSWLAVSKPSEDAADEDTHPPNSRSASPPFLLWIGVGVSLVALLLLVMGLLLCWKHRVLVCLSSEKPTSHSAEDHSVSGEDGVHHLHHATRPVVKKQRKERVSGGDNAGDPDLVTYAAVKNQKRKEGTRSCRTEETVIYSSVRCRD